MNKDREDRYTWDKDNAPEVMEEGNGELLDLAGLMQRVKEARAKADREKEVQPV